MIPFPFLLHSYIETNPLHPSQKVLKRNVPEIYADWISTHNIITLNVIINHELVNTILSFGKDLIVLEPLSLKKTIIKNRIRTDIQTEY